MELTGHSIIAGAEAAGTHGTFRAVDPATGALVGPDYTGLTTDELRAATAAAAEALGPVWHQGSVR